MGPKKGGGSRGTSKNPPKGPKPPEEGDYIVFSNAKDKPGSKNAGSKDPKRESSKDGAANPPADGQEQPKRPDTKKLIGGASWTGKLPVNMLSEHCQKQKWEKPEYTMMKTGPDAFLSSVILKQTNQKTKEMTVLPAMRVPPDLKQAATRPTAVEARHFAAAYALFRVCNMKNLHMMLPPTYRDLWKGEFTQLKNADTKDGKAWMYEADPFTAKREQDDAAAQRQKKAADRAKAKDQAKSSPSAPGLPAGGGGNYKENRGWQHVPKVDMGNRIRRNIEEILRQRTNWNPHGVIISEREKSALINQYTALGFRQSHVEEAVSECKDGEEVLEWLLIYIPEDDLPSWSLAEGYSAGVSLASSDLARESQIKRLAATGYSVDLCTEVLQDKGGDERLAAEYLQNVLIHGNGEVQVESAADDSGQWDEEQSTLDAIFDDRFKALNSTSCQIRGNEEQLRYPITFLFQKPSRPYPDVPPILSILADEIPAYIRLSAVRQAIQHAEESLTGEPMIFGIIDWLELNLPRILENPGKLRDISITTTPQGKGGNSLSQQKGKRPRKSQKQLDWRASSPQSIALRDAWQNKQSTPAQKKMLSARQSLPAWPMRDEIVHTINSHQVTIISGETGSGKSTQSVQFVLDDMILRELGSVANIICTQPRRISALGLADRVSDERCSAVGEEVGYIIRGDSKVKRGVSKITFVTTGVLLRRIQSSHDEDGNIADSLADITHVVVDEVHERSLDTDFLLALLREVLAHRKDLKVILMSATLDADVFSKYFGGDKQQVGRVNIPGRTYPVEDLYVDDVIRKTGFNAGFAGYDSDDFEQSNGGAADQSVGKTLQNLGMGINYELITATVRYIDAQLGNQMGAILIFLPGTLEIDKCLAAVSKLPNSHPLPLHGSLLPAEQRRVFPPPPPGKRKVIAATNVAETSITVEDVVAVIDTGRVKETSYDPKDNMVRLEEVWASQAACKQRRGRAGRVRAGTCYKLYTRKAEANMAPRPDPEIRRVPLEQLCLSVKAMAVEKVSKFLANTLTPPESVAVDGAMELLHRIGALDNERLTSLGKYLSMIPADLRCAKLMVYGFIFGCLESCMTIAAILTVKSPFVSPRDKRDEAKEAKSSFSKGDGDLLVDLAAYQQFTERSRTQNYRQTQSWCNANFLSHQTLRDISSNRSQFLSSLKDIGIVPMDYRDTDIKTQWNRHNDNMRLLRALIAGAFNPQIASISFPSKKFAASMTGTVEQDPEARTIKYFNQENGRVFVHPSSTLFDAQSYTWSASYVSYFTKMATSKVFIRDLTPFNAYGLLLFSGPIALDTLGRGVIVDGWLRLRGWARIGVLVSRLRAMLDDVLARKIEDPGFDIGGDEVIDVVRRLVELNGLDQ
ncbi:hypothetical protein FQN54_003236 [Arachnomyces sp. PD_36]|nr:hypothetical protein FQN54_003236 [Arachnomyces sp. PD_36]